MDGVSATSKKKVMVEGEISLKDQVGAKAARFAQTVRRMVQINALVNNKKKLKGKGMMDAGMAGPYEKIGRCVALTPFGFSAQCGFEGRAHLLRPAAVGEILSRAARDRNVTVERDRWGHVKEKGSYAWAPDYRLNSSTTFLWEPGTTRRDESGSSSSTGQGAAEGNTGEALPPRRRCQRRVPIAAFPRVAGTPLAASQVDVDQEVSRHTWRRRTQRKAPVEQF